MADMTRDLTREQEPEDEGERKFSAILSRVHAKQFAAVCLDHDEGGRVTTDEMYDAYVRWAEGAGRVPNGRKALGMALRAIGVEPYRTKDQRGYAGVRLRV